MPTRLSISASHITALIIVIVIILLQCGRQEPANEMVAKVGNRTISITSFERAYLPVILYGDKFDSPETRKQTLDYLIGDKLLAQEAEKAEMDTFSILKHVTRVAEQKAIARHVYDDWVRKKIPVPTDDDLRLAFERSNKSMLVRHLFASTKSASDSLYAILQSGSMTFEELAARVFTDSLLAADGGSLGWLAWGDLDENLENAAYDAPVGKFTEPVESQYGWHILRVDDYKKQVITSETDYLQTKPALNRRIYERREAIIGKQVLNDFMRDQQVSFNREIAKPVFNAIIARRAPKDDMAPGEREKPLEREFATLRDELAPYMDQTIVSFSGEGWTVSGFLERLPEMGRREFYNNLYLGTANLVRDELLSRAGYAEGYEKAIDVVEEVQDRKDKILAQLYLQTLWDTLTITEKMVGKYYQDNWQRRYQGPDSLRLQEILVSDKALADTLMFRLRSGADFDELAQRFTQRVGFEHTIGDLGWQVTGKTAYEIEYSQALKTKTGVPVGPIETESGWAIVRSTDRVRYAEPLRLIRDKVQKDMENYHQSIVRQKALDEARSHYKIDRYQDVLSMIDKK